VAHPRLRRGRYIAHFAMGAKSRPSGGVLFGRGGPSRPSRGRTVKVRPYLGGGDPSVDGPLQGEMPTSRSNRDWFRSALHHDSKPNRRSQTAATGGDADLPIKSGQVPVGATLQRATPKSYRGYFHSHNLEWVFPWASTSNSKMVATEFSRVHFGEAVE
jgi:hypothetical protein